MPAKMTRRNLLRKAVIGAVGLAGAGAVVHVATRESRWRSGAKEADFVRHFKGLRFIVSPEELARLTARHGLTEAEALTFNIIQENLIAKGVHLTPERIAETLGKNPGAIAQDIKHRILAVEGKVSADEIARLRRVEEVFRVVEAVESHHQSTIAAMRQKLEAYYTP